MRAGWTMAGVPVIAAEMARACGREADRILLMMDTASRVSRRHSLSQGGSDMAESRDRYRYLQHAVDAAERIWVAAPMAALALEASQTVPSLLPEDIPSTAGAMFFEDPLPAVDTSVVGGLTLRLPADEAKIARAAHGLGSDGEVLARALSSRTITHTDPVPVDAVSWAPAAETPWGGLSVQLWTRTERLPYPMLGVTIPLSPILRISGPLPTPLGDEAGLHPVTRSVLSLLAASWSLMRAPRAVSVTRWDTGRNRPVQPGQSLGGRRQVTIMEARPLEHRVTEHATGTGRRVRVRHVVRGHWTQQVHGRERALRRQQWVEAYIRGPADAPFVATERVIAWRK